MTIRGSGALGLQGAYGILLAAVNSNGNRNYIKESGLLLKSLDLLQ